MGTPLDTQVARAVYVARLLERALHDAGPWTMKWGPFDVPAERIVEADAVTFSAVFPPVCHLGEPDPTVTLCCQGEPVAYKDIEFPGDAPFTLLWRLAGEAVEALA